MAFNIIDMIQSSLTSENVGAIAGSLGMGSDTVQKGLGAAIPAVLAGVLGSARHPAGRQTLDTALESADTGLLDKLSGMLYGGGGSSLIAAGSTLLASFLGESKLGTLTGALASHFGVSGESGKSLLGLAAPMLMSMLAGKKKSEGLDTGGLLGKLMGQKDLIAKAIPEGISSQLKGSGILDDLMGDTGAGVQSVSTAARSTAQSAVSAPPPAAKKSSLLRWVIGALIVLAILYFLSVMLGKRDSGERTSLTAPAQELTVGGVNLADTVQTVFGDLGRTLNSITDAASARAALPQLDGIQENLKKLENAAGGLSPSARSTLAGLINTSLPEVRQTADRLLTDGAIGPIVKPALDSILGRLSSLAGA
jgi:hypothetical protein